MLARLERGRLAAVIEPLEILERHNASAGADLVYSGEYLVVIGRKV